MKRHFAVVAVALVAVFGCLVYIGTQASGADATNSFPIKPVNGPEHKTFEVKKMSKNKVKFTICERGDCQSAIAYGGDVRLALNFAGVTAFEGTRP